MCIFYIALILLSYNKLDIHFLMLWILSCTELVSEADLYRLKQLYFSLKNTICKQLQSEEEYALPDI